VELSEFLCGGGGGVGTLRISMAINR
jgi:hypothetical protein